MEDLNNLYEEIQALKQRNQRVEAEKAWETSLVRVGSIMLVTYIFAALLLWLIGASNYLLGAFVPVLGFLLSTLSLPPLKKWWIGRRTD